MTKNIPDLSFSLHALTPLCPPLYDVARGKPERSGGGGEYMNYNMFFSHTTDK